MNSTYHGFHYYFIKVHPLLRYGVAVSEDKIKVLADGFEFLNIFLADSVYVADQVLTIADISLFATITSIQVGIWKLPAVIHWSIARKV